MRQYIRMMTLILISMLYVNNLRASFCFLRPAAIDSLPQLKKYDFIALVKIIDDQDLEKPPINIQTVGSLTIKTIELFKGERVDKILEYSKNSTCDIGISKDEEWILFGEIKNGKISVDVMSRNIRYKKNNGVRDWRNQTGFYELKQLRKLYHHPPEIFDNVIRKEFYPNGQIEIIANYSNGKLNGERTIWYPDGTLLGKQFYVNDILDGKSQWFYPSGQIHEEEYNLKGKHCNTLRNYYDSTSIQIFKLEFIKQYYKDINEKDSLDLVRSKVQLRSETVYNSLGQRIISREYSIFGILSKEEFSDPDRKFSTIIFYHNNGTISSIMYTLNGKIYGHYQTYGENGFPKESWDYDENGEKIK